MQNQNKDEIRNEEDLDDCDIDEYTYFHSSANININKMPSGPSEEEKVSPTH